MMSDYYHYGFGDMMGFFGFGSILMVIFWGLVIWGIVALASSYFGKGEEKTGSKALEILKERYAKGEISKQEFEHKKEDLNK